MTLTAPPQRRTIWVVDDSPTDAERVRRALVDRYGVEVFSDGATVLERLATGHRPDLLVLDWVMPGVSGIDVCRFLRSPEGRLPQVPVVLLTSRRDTEQIVEALDAGANDFVAKPFAPEELLARVAALVRTLELVERAEAAEADVRALLASSPDAMLAVDAQGVLTYANAEAARVLGHAEAALVGRALQDVVPDLPHVLRNISVGPAESFLPLADVRIGGRVYSPSVRVLPSDSAASTTVALRDVTERRQAEERRLDFYSIVAHDLRTPLSAMLVRLELIFRGKHGLLPAGLVTDLRKTERNVRALVAMINDFLELARLEGVGYKLDRQPLDLVELTRSTLDDFRPLLDASGLEARVDDEGGPVEVLGDRRRLQQVLANLVGNAIKFTPAGGSVTARVRLLPDCVEAQVEDTGPGIPADVLPQLFERYTRSLHAGPHGGGGEGREGSTGLGLMIVREVVEAHGGRVGVESRPGQGSRFWFRLPRTQLRAPTG